MSQSKKNQSSQFYKVKTLVHIIHNTLTHELECSCFGTSFSYPFSFGAVFVLWRSVWTSWARAPHNQKISKTKHTDEWYSRFDANCTLQSAIFGNGNEIMVIQNEPPYVAQLLEKKFRV